MMASGGCQPPVWCAAVGDGRLLERTNGGSMMADRSGRISFVSAGGAVFLAVCSLVVATARADDSTRVQVSATTGPISRLADLAVVGATVRSAIDQGFISGAVVHISRGGR